MRKTSGANLITPHKYFEHHGYYSDPKNCEPYMCIIQYIVIPYNYRFDCATRVVQVAS